ncbi:hypothetical protein DS901_07935 [Loktanella sp. D2R18]|uniref:hypothetical protein n=1 Tax=Rhodobacterales TaxID=204455 RepID=UPI000DE8953C|nr:MULTISPECIES: hypothetical protein [Rhodobacterales]MDO6589701.1 hypothetical protein [Yoonia sp. 1_MG-2023]RBW44326.1 hypothetical protein DS901_07935 [Loktanella sp. D2R18]
MTQPILFRTDLGGQKVPIHWEEMHPVRRDILHYFEENLDEPMNVYLIPEYTKLEYWKYLSVFFTKQYAESKRYAWLFERGCLALLNGLALDVLGEQLHEGSGPWLKGKDIAQSSLPYLQTYTPTEAILKDGQEMLIDSFSFIAQMNSSDLDWDGYPKFIANDQGLWFTRNIIGDYYRKTAALDFG